MKMATGTNNFGSNSLRLIPLSIIDHEQSKTLSEYDAYVVFLVYGNTIGMVVALHREGANYMTVGGSLSITVQLVNNREDLLINNTSDVHNYRVFGFAFKTA